MMDTSTENGKESKELTTPTTEKVEYENEPTEMESSEKPQPCTPAIVRTRQLRKDFQVSSPSDAIMSPCTQRLFGRSRIKKGGNSMQPTSLLKEKQKSSLTKTD